MSENDALKEEHMSLPKWCRLIYLSLTPTFFVSFRKRLPTGLFATGLPQGFLFVCPYFLIYVYSIIRNASTLHAFLSTILFAYLFN